MKAIVRARILVLVVALFVLFPGVGFATDIVCGSQGLVTLQDYINLGSHGCVFGDKLFYNFEYRTALNSGFTIAPTASEILVTTIGSPLNPGFTFGSAWNATAFAGIGGSSALDVQLQFAVDVLTPGFLITDASLRISGFSSSNFGIGSFAEDLCLGGIFGVGTWGGTCSGTNADGLLDITLPGGTNPKTTFFNQGYTQVGVFKDFLLAAFQPQEGFSQVSFSAFSQQFSQNFIPEPGTYVLMGGGLLALGLLRRKYRKR